MFITTEEYLLNSNSNPFATEACQFSTIIEFEPIIDSEGLIVFSESLLIGELPKGLELTENSESTQVISGIPVSLNSYHPIKNYIRKSIQGDLFSIPFKDVLRDDDITPMTLHDIINYPKIHKSGINYLSKGNKAYHIDGGGPLVDFEITSVKRYINSETAEVTEYSKTFKIKVKPSWNAKEFIMSYGSDNPLVNDDMEVLSPEEYLKWREENGHEYKSGC